ncbi:hypothetical protein AAZX31_04G048300 [Glycine max]
MGSDPNHVFHKENKANKWDDDVVRTGVQFLCGLDWIVAHSSVSVLFCFLFLFSFLCLCIRGCVRESKFEIEITSTCIHTRIKITRVVCSKNSLPYCGFNFLIFFQSPQPYLIQ